MVRGCEDVLRDVCGLGVRWAELELHVTWPIHRLYCMSPPLQEGIETTEVCLLRQHLPHLYLTFWDLMEATVCL